MIMKQEIKIRIADSEYPLIAETPEKEEGIREAAKIINRMIVQYKKNYPSKELTEILSFVAINLGKRVWEMQKQIENAGKEFRQMNKDIEDYLENIDTSR